MNPHGFVHFVVVVVEPLSIKEVEAEADHLMTDLVGVDIVTKTINPLTVHATRVECRVTTPRNVIF